MTPELQAEIAAIRQSYEQDVANMSHEKANLAAQCGALALKLKKAEEELAELKKPAADAKPVAYPHAYSPPAAA